MTGLVVAIPVTGVGPARGVGRDNAEGLAVPTDFVHDLKGYDDEEVRLVMRENAMGLLRPA